MDKDEYEELMQDLMERSGVDYTTIEDLVSYLLFEDLLDTASVYNKYIKDELDDE